MIPTWGPIEYREFYDVPRCILVEYDGTLFYLESLFDEKADDYASHYTVYEMPRPLGNHYRTGSWAELPPLGKRIGQVPVRDVNFDPTRREKMDASILDSIRRPK